MSGTAESQSSFVSSWVWQRGSGVFEILRFVRSGHTPVRKVSSSCTRRQLAIDRSCSILVHIAYTCHFRLGGRVRICNTFDGYAKQIRREKRTIQTLGRAEQALVYVCDIPEHSSHVGQSSDIFQQRDHFDCEFGCRTESEVCLNVTPSQEHCPLPLGYCVRFEKDEIGLRRRNPILTRATVPRDQSSGTLALQIRVPGVLLTVFVAADHAC